MSQLPILTKFRNFSRILSVNKCRYTIDPSFSINQSLLFSTGKPAAKHLLGQPLIKTFWTSNFLSMNKFSSAANERNASGSEVKITYVGRDGEEHVINGKIGDNVMYLAQKHDLDIEGACEASLACCTCHVYVENYFDKLTEIEEEEEDMLDLAPFLQENSRLSCQIILSKELDGLIVRIPSATRNFYVDGHKPKPH